MFQNFTVCRARLTGVTRCTQLSRRFGNRCNRILEPCEHQLLQQSMQTVIPQSFAVRLYSNAARRPGFFQQVIKNIKDEFSKDKEMKETLKKFREEADKLEQTEALKMARQKFQAVESETNKGTEVIKEKLEGLKGKVQEVIEEASKTEIGKKAGQLGEEISKSAKGAAETLSETSYAIGKSDAFKKFTETAEVVREELGQTGIHGRVYVPPKKLRKRNEIEYSKDRQVEANESATGIELHKDSKFFESWQNFKDKNPYMNKVLDWKMKYDESDNPVIRASRMLTDTIGELVGAALYKTELSEALTKICKLDPTFNKGQFLRDCETDIIPNILEAMVTGNLEILKDWCHEAPYNVIATPIKEVRKLGYHLQSKILDIDNVELTMGKVIDQGPVLIISFITQQIMCVRDSKNTIIEGDPEKVLRVSYIWVLCRDPTEPNPRAAWRLLDLSAKCNEQFV